jgi:hypothetical protein
MSRESTGGAATETRTGTQQQHGEGNSPSNSPFSMDRDPKLGLEVLYRPNDHNRERQFPAKINLIEGQGAGARVELHYDHAGQRVYVQNVRYGMDPGCWHYNTELERDRALQTATWLQYWAQNPESIPQGLLGERGLFTAMIGQQHGGTIFDSATGIGMQGGRGPDDPDSAA